MCCVVFFFFKQKTAYEMRISDWSSDVCSSDLGEQDRDALDALKANLKALGATDRAAVRAGSVLALGPAPRAFDLLLPDAPYGTGAASVALDKLPRLCRAGPDSCVAIETAAKQASPVACFETHTERRDHKTRLTQHGKAQCRER